MEEYNPEYEEGLIDQVKNLASNAESTFVDLLKEASQVNFDYKYIDPKVNRGPKFTSPKKKRKKK